MRAGRGVCRDGPRAGRPERARGRRQSTLRRARSSTRPRTLLLSVVAVLLTYGLFFLLLALLPLVARCAGVIGG